MSVEEKQCRFCGTAIRLGDDDSPDNIVMRGEELAHRTCVFDQSQGQEKGMAGGWRDIQWTGYGWGWGAGSG
jgi:hypothetical protein